MLPFLRDLVFLGGGTFVFVAEALGQARWGPMLLSMVFAAGPAAVTAYWGRTAVNAGLDSSPSSVSSPSPSSSSSGER